MVESGPRIAIHHPEFTAEHPRQEIPIMVFTIKQWGGLGAGKWWIGAAPIPPIELTRNDGYVFALPALYNYAFLAGWEEVEEIIQTDAIRSFGPGLP